MESPKFVSHRERMSGEFALLKDSHPSKFEWRAQILIKLGFRELCDSEWSGLCTFDNIAISYSSDTDPWINFCDPHWELICCNKWHPRTSEISIPLEIAVETHFHGRHGTKTISVLLPANRKTSWFWTSTSKFGLLNIRLYSATRKHLFLS